MIYDRTQLDVDEAKRIKLDKYQKGFPLTDEEEEILERGFLTQTTLNRIENEEKRLFDVLKEKGYLSGEITSVEWTDHEIFGSSDFERILDNLGTLLGAVSNLGYSAEMPIISYHFENINAIEKILNDIAEMID